MTLPDHIGWDLVRAARVWKAEFIEEVVRRGHAWFAEARGRIAEFIARDGTEQTAIAERSGLTKQAVAQHLDALEADGLIARETDPSDSRRRRVVWTRQGRDALADIDTAKRAVEERLKARIGPERFAALRSGLKAVAEDAEPD